VTKTLEGRMILAWTGEQNVKPILWELYT
jgi:hypothetical protein